MKKKSPNNGSMSGKCVPKVGMGAQLDRLMSIEKLVTDIDSKSLLKSTDSNFHVQDDYTHAHRYMLGNGETTLN